MYATIQETPALAAARRLAASNAGGGAVLPVLDDQICAEAGLWAPDAARRAAAQTGGDVARSVALLRVWAAALPQLAAEVVDPADVHVLRRVSAAYPEVPGGQWLGASPELASRLIDWDDDPIDDHDVSTTSIDAETPPTRADCRRVRDLFDDVRIAPVDDDGAGRDPARTALAPPLDRATRLGVLARGETGSLVALASLVLGRRREAILAESTAAIVDVRIPHPRTGEPCAVAEVPVVEAEAVVDALVDGRPALAVGWGASLGSLERRAIALALLDGAAQADGASPTAMVMDDDTVLAAVDGSATNGFVEHLRLPHYASFASYLDGVRSVE